MSTQSAPWKDGNQAFQQQGLREFTAKTTCLNQKMSQVSDKDTIIQNYYCWIDKKKTKNDRKFE